MITYLQGSSIVSNPSLLMPSLVFCVVADTYRHGIADPVFLYILQGNCMAAGENAAGGKDFHDSVFPRRHVSSYLKSVSWEACDGRRRIMGMSFNVSIGLNACYSG